MLQFYYIVRDFYFTPSTLQGRICLMYCVSSADKFVSYVLANSVQIFKVPNLKCMKK